MTGIEAWWASASEGDRQLLTASVRDGSYPGEAVMQSLLASHVNVLTVVSNSANVSIYGPDVVAFFGIPADSVKPWRDGGTRAGDLRVNQWLRLDGLGGQDDSYWLRIDSFQAMNENRPWDHRRMIVAIVNDTLPVFVTAPYDWPFYAVDDPLDSLD